MKYSTTTGTLGERKCDCIVATLSTCEKLVRRQRSSDPFQAAMQDFEDKPGKTLLVNLGSDVTVRRLLVAGGLDGNVSEADFSKSVKAVASQLQMLKARSAIWALGSVRVTGRDVYWKVSSGIHALSSTIYSFDAYRRQDPPIQLKAVAFHADARTRNATARAVRHGQAARAGLDLARDLGNQPPNVCTPSYLLREARKLGRDAKVTVTALDEKKMTDLGMGAFMAVTRGSDTPGKMIIVHYRGAKQTSEAPIVLVGKGITFDTGGISLKQPANMHEMKWDMCGAAAVLGATRAAIDAQLPLNLVTIVAAAENMPSGRATRPGDIVRTSAGKTVEILNTDAEGRLVLCDALTYAARYKPAAIIDVATLTGACIVALGNHATAVYANDDDLAGALIQAGEYSGDRGWRMPLWDEYQAALKSQFADVANVSQSGGAGSVTAACFLSRFVEGQHWAHLDIAGTAFPRGPQNGATGRPVSMLFRYLVNRVAQ